MGAVNGCHLKYVGVSLLSALTIPTLSGYPPPIPFNLTNEDGSPSSPYFALYNQNSDVLISYTPLFLYYYMIYSTVLNMIIAILFKLRLFPTMFNKSPNTGRIPLLSYLLFSPFFIPTYLYTFVHHQIGEIFSSVPAASEVRPGYYVGGRYGEQLTTVKHWGGTLDLTCEFPESCINKTKKYMSLPVWDGTPPSIDDIERGAKFIASSHALGPVMVHCAHGRGRSCLLMCAGLVRAGEVKDWREGFEVVKKGRKVCKLNAGMRKALGEWEEKYGKKA